MSLNASKVITKPNVTINIEEFNFYHITSDAIGQVSY